MQSAALKAAQAVAQREFFNQVRLKMGGMKLSPMADHFGWSHTTLTRPVNSGETIIGAAKLRQVSEWSGVPVPDILQRGAEAEVPPQTNAGLGAVYAHQLERALNEALKHVRADNVPGLAIVTAAVLNQMVQNPAMSNEEIQSRGESAAETYRLLSHHPGGSTQRREE